MTEELKKATLLLSEGNYTCVLLKREECYTSEQRGVTPLLNFLESGRSFRDFCASDRVIGLGAAHLYLLLGIRELWAGVISYEAEALLQANGVSVECGERVPYIINRKGDGRCPIESAVLDCPSSEDALQTIKDTLILLQRKK